jgi:hypothetical protein
MSDQKKPSWNDALADDQTDLGMSKNMLRALAQMNPNLKGDKNTEELMSAVQRTLKQPRAEAPAAGAKLSETLTQQKNAYAREMKACDEEQAKLDERRARLRTQVLGRVLDKCVQVDLEQPEAKQALTVEKAFLEAIGFSAAKLSERKKKQPAK